MLLSFSRRRKKIAPKAGSSFLWREKGDWGKKERREGRIGGEENESQLT